MLIAQISDTHIKPQGRLAYGKVNTECMLRTCITHLQNSSPQPDIVLITGDLVDFGLLEEYAVLRDCLSGLSQPILLIAGNHDERKSLRSIFSESKWSYLHQDTEFVQYSLVHKQMRFIGLDTLIPNSGAGLLCDKRLKWLDEILSESDLPTVIMMHHPPFLTGISHMDQQGLSGREAFAELIAHHPQICRILCGHLHRPIQTVVSGVLVSTCPSPAHQVELGLSADAPDRFVMEPPGYQLHQWDGQQMVSHQVVIGDFDGPFPFRVAGRLIA